MIILSGEIFPAEPGQATVAVPIDLYEAVGNAFIDHGEKHSIRTEVIQAGVAIYYAKGHPYQGQDLSPILEPCTATDLEYNKPFARLSRPLRVPKEYGVTTTDLVVPGWHVLCEDAKTALERTLNDGGFGISFDN